MSGAACWDEPAEVGTTPVGHLELPRPAVALLDAAFERDSYRWFDCFDGQAELG